HDELERLRLGEVRLGVRLGRRRDGFEPALDGARVARLHPARSRWWKSRQDGKELDRPLHALALALGCDPVAELRLPYGYLFPRLPAIRDRSHEPDRRRQSLWSFGCSRLRPRRPRRLGGLSHDRSPEFL